MTQANCIKVFPAKKDISQKKFGTKTESVLVPSFHFATIVNRSYWRCI